MRTTRQWLAVLASSLLLWSLAPAAQAATPTTRSAAFSETQVVQDCLNYRVAPRHRIVIACADAGILLNDLHWRYWHRYDARGRGYLVVNDCKPSCANGHFHRYPALFHLTRARTDHRHFVFHHVTTRFTGSRPRNARSYRQMQLPGFPV